LVLGFKKKKRNAAALKTGRLARGALKAMRFKAILGTIGILGTLGTASHAAEFNMVPSITARQEYNSNIDLDANKNKAQDDFVTRIIPRLRSTYRTERLSLGLTAEAVPTLYWKNEDSSYVDFSGSGDLNYALTPRLSTSADARFTVDNQPDFNVATTGQSSGRRYLSGADLGLRYALTEITSASINLGYDRTDYTDNQDGEDFQGFTVGAGLSRDLQQWLPRTVGQLGAGYGYYDYETSTIQSGYGSLGLTHRVSEKWDASGMLGVRYAHSEFDQTELQFVPPFFLVPVTVRQSNSGWGGIGQLDLSYTDGMTRYALSALHDLNVTFSESPTQLTSLRFSVNHRIRDEWSAGFSAGWSWNRNQDEQFSSTAIDETTYNIAPSLSWTPAREWRLTAGYSFLWLHDGEDNYNADRHLVFCEASFGMSLFDMLEGLSKAGGFYQPGRLIFPEYR
jgi:hypothetical protein